jgi:hypothetical protein
MIRKPQKLFRDIFAIAMLFPEAALHFAQSLSRHGGKVLTARSLSGLRSQKMGAGDL